MLVVLVALTDADDEELDESDALPSILMLVQSPLVPLYV